jgi:hypothetical protein
VLDLLMELQKQAPKAGGKVHAMIGNHEAMNIYGDLRYVIPEEYASFRTGESQQLLEGYFEQAELPELKKQKPQVPDEELKAEWLKTHPPGWVEHRFAFGPRGKYGKWIRENKAVIKVNDIIFMHGGWSPKYAAMTIPDLNQMVRGELMDFAKLQGGIAMDTDGPLWYRGLAQAPEETLVDHLDKLLAAQSASAIAVGHTPTAGAILTRFGGKVIMIDVGLSKAYGGPPACLVIDGGKRFAMHRGKLLDLPSQPAGLLAYIKAAAALDPQPSPLQKLIDRGLSADLVKEDK